MKKSITTLLIILCCNYIVAQQRPVMLMGESADGKTVKLLWFLKTWEPELNGFDIKRRTTNGEWQKLNSTVIFPEISIKKSLINVETNGSENQRLKNKLQRFIAKKEIKEIPAASFLQQLLTEDDMMQSVTFTIASDYDLALLMGFGLVDRTATADKKYEYGLFFVINNQAEENAAATFNWTYGTAAMLDPSLLIQAKPIARTKRIQLVWKLDTLQVKDTKIAGYNIYKQTGINWIKLNTTPVANMANNRSTFTYFDNSSLATQKVNYAFAMQSMFGNEGKRTEYSYNPLEHPLMHSVPQLADINGADGNLANDFNINWTFPKETEKFIKGFIVEKANLPQQFKAVSDLLPASQRSFTDKSFSPPASYVKLRVSVVYKDEEQLPGNEKLVYYFPAIALPAPTNVTGKWVKENDKTFIALSWNERTPADSLIQKYYLYASDPFDEKMTLQSGLPAITQNHFRYEVFNQKATTYKIKIVPVSKFSTEGQASDIITVYAPATVLTMPQISSYIVDEQNRITVKWNYDDLKDIKGFRLFQNGNMVAAESDLKKDMHSFTTAPVKDDERYIFTLQAVTEHGIESPVSFPVNVLIYKKSKN